MWEIQKYSLPGRPSSQNWIKSKIIYHFLMNFDAFLNVFLILRNFGWMVDLAMSIFVFLTKFLIFWHPWHPWVCIRSDLKPLLKQIVVIPPTVSRSYFSVSQQLRSELFAKWIGKIDALVNFIIQKFFKIVKQTFFSVFSGERSIWED